MNNVERVAKTMADLTAEGKRATLDAIAEKIGIKPEEVYEIITQNRDSIFAVAKEYGYQM